jgi:ubiquinone/menaquinone biosynthesis C-methylase UbiE
MNLSKHTIEERYYDTIREHPEISNEDVQIIARLRPVSKAILDVGCGSGGFLEACRSRPGDAVGLDPSSAAVKRCRTSGLAAIQGDATSLPFASESFDVVRAKEIIEHIVDLRTFMLEVHRVLRPGGVFVSRTPTPMSMLYPVGNFYDDYTHVRPLSRSGLQHLLADASFEVEYIRGYTAGRNKLERTLGQVLGRVIPHTWLAVARKPVAEDSGLYQAAA